MVADLSRAEAVVRRYWGHPGLRPVQRRIVAAALRGRDVLALLPTGAGKSLCFQVPALLRPGVTVVISPLISLMQDQVTALRDRGLAAAMISSAQSAPARDATLEAVRTGRVRLLYIAPERLAGMTPLLRAVGVGMLAVDEAHCVSEWGHEFRPHYRALGRHRHRLDRPPVLAVTATATRETRADVERVLRLERPVRVVSSFDRPNLHFSVAEIPDEQTRVRIVRSRLQATDGSAVVYVPTRNRTDGVAAALRRLGVEATPYHAGLPARDRSAILRGFMAGRIRFVVATNAFGMGIDYPRVRSVLHLGIPVRPEAYYQEAGRAGRDGAAARCHLLWRRADLVVARRLAAGSRPAVSNGLDAMIRYVRTRRCRRRVLLEYFGERITGCTGCDRCDSSLFR